MDCFINNKSIHDKNKIKGNPKSSYYDGDGEVTMLDIWLSQMSNEEFIGLCKGNIVKYIFRKKGSKEDKIRDYEKASDYMRFLLYATNNNKQ